MTRLTDTVATRAVFALVIACAASPRGLAQQCITNHNHTGAPMGQVLSETLVRVPVYAVDLTSTARQVLRDGVDGWNARSNYTKTVFEIVTEPELGSLVFKTQGPANECAEWLPDNGMITLTQSAQDGMDTEYDVGVYLVKHELGDFLGLADRALSPSPPSLMNQLGVPMGNSCAQAMQQGSEFRHSTF